MKNLRLYQVDAFTNQRFEGNPAGVILNADGLTDEEMQLIARELNNSESVFALRPDGDDHDVRLRFFTPTAEIPMCGHNTIAFHALRALIGEAGAGKYVQKTKAGLIPVEVEERSGKFFVNMTQTNFSMDPPLDLETSAPVLKALGILPADLHPEWPIQVVSTGNRKLFVGVKSRDRLNALKPDMAALKNLAGAFRCTGYYVFTLGPGEPLSFGRMFAPQIGIEEDPVTGMAIAPLGVYLVANKLVSLNKGSIEFTAKQGEAMGRPGLAYVRVTADASDTVTEVKVGGEATLVFQGELHLNSN